MKRMFKDYNIRDFSKLGKSNVISSNAMVVSSHPIASSVGLEILKNGGNAVDASLAMNAVLCVAEPHMTGIGGDYPIYARFYNNTRCCCWVEFAP